MRGLAVAAVLVLGVGLPVAGSSFAAHSVDGGGRAGAGLRSDFNGDGFADLAVGTPSENLGNDYDGSGAVNVLYGSAGGLTGSGSQFFTEDSPGVRGVAEMGDHFGAALAAGDFDRDGFADLAVGSRDGVNVLYGGTRGLTGHGSQLFSQNSPGIPEQVEHFSGPLTAGDFDYDGFADLAAGGTADVNGIGVGAVSVLYGGPAGLTGHGSQFFTQDS